MARKQKQNDTTAPKPSSVVNRDVFQRLNFLYQTSVFLTHHALTNKAESSTSAVSPRAKSAWLGLAKHHARSIKTIGNKSQLRIDPSVKRSICKGCHIPLLPGVTSRVRIKRSSVHGHRIVHTCLQCSKRLSIPAPPLNPEDDSPVEAQTLPEASEPTATSEGPQDPPERPKKQKRKVKPRDPPFFERKSHIIYRGNDKVE